MVPDGASGGIPSVPGPVDVGVMIIGGVPVDETVAVAGEIIMAVGAGGVNGLERPVCPTSTSKPDNGRSREKTVFLETSTFGSKVTEVRRGGAGGTGYGVKLVVINQ